MDTPTFTGATTEPPRRWPPHVRDGYGQAEGAFVECVARVCHRPQRVTYVTAPGQQILAGPVLDDIWRAALEHERCSDG